MINVIYTNNDKQERTLVLPTSQEDFTRFMKGNKGFETDRIEFTSKNLNGESIDYDFDFNGIVDETCDLTKLNALASLMQYAFTESGRCAKDEIDAFIEMAIDDYVDSIDGFLTYLSQMDDCEFYSDITDDRNLAMKILGDRGTPSDVIDDLDDTFDLEDFVNDDDKEYWFYASTGGIQYEWLAKDSEFDYSDYVLEYKPSYEPYDLSQSSVVFSLYMSLVKRRGFDGTIEEGYITGFINDGKSEPVVFINNNRVTAEELMNEWVYIDSDMPVAKEISNED